MQTSSCNFGFEQVPGNFLSCAEYQNKTTVSSYYNAIILTGGGSACWGKYSQRLTSDTAG